QPSGAGRIGTARGGLVMGSDADADSGVAFLLDLVMVATFEALSALPVGIFNRRGDHQATQRAGRIGTARGAW
uniref:hypothetical protein n=1 Tax=uncultured Lamprocystis sp. TaxID=543132 RepID=UPI0025D20B51